MMYCKNCGSEVEDHQDVCLKCGTSTKSAPTVVDNGGFGWGLLGFCVPLAGLILYLVWKQERPKTSKSAGIGALISLIFCAVFYVIYAIILVGLMSTM